MNEKERKEKKKEKKRNEKRKEKSTEVEEVPEIWTRERLKKNRNKELLHGLSSLCILRPIISISKKKEGKTTKLLLDSFFRLIVDIMKFN